MSYQWVTMVLLAATLVACAGPAPPAPAPAAAPAPAPGTASAAPPAPPAPLPMRAATATASGTGLIPWVPFELGLFEQYGLAIDSIPDIASSTTAVQTLVARDIDVTFIVPNPAIEAQLKGAPPMVMIANTPPGTGFKLFGAPGVAGVEELRGKVLGANAVGSSSYFLLTFALREHGLQVERDYQVISVGNSPAQVAALQQGQTHGAVLPSPANIRARRAGLPELKDLHNLPYNSFGPVVRREMLDDPTGRETLTRYLKASLEGIARLRQDRELAYEMIRKTLKLDDQESVEEIYQAYLPRRLPYVLGEALPLVLESLAERDPAARTANPEQYYDNSLLAELERSGFIDTLYR